MAITTVCTEIESLIYSSVSFMKQMLHLWGIWMPVILGKLIVNQLVKKFVHVYGNQLLTTVSQGRTSGQQVVRCNSEWNFHAYELFGNILKYTENVTTNLKSRVDKWHALFQAKNFTGKEFSQTAVYLFTGEPNDLHVHDRISEVKLEWWSCSWYTHCMSANQGISLFISQ